MINEDDQLNDFYGNENDALDDILFDGAQEDCHVFDILIGKTLSSKPFGLTWDLDKIEKFLRALGYKIMERHDDEGDVYKVAIKPGSKVIPESSNLKAAFDSELQDIILSKLLEVVSTKR